MDWEILSMNKAILIVRFSQGLTLSQALTDT